MTSLDKIPAHIINAYGKKYALKTGELTRLEVDDSHYYFVDGMFYPGVTTILSEAAPVGPGLRMWWQNKDKSEIDEILSKAQSAGSRVHDSIEQLLKGEILETHLFNEKERRCIVSFIDWFRYFKPENYQTEQPIASVTYRYAGTLDLVAMVGGERWLIDFKTSSAIQFSHQLQIMAYKRAYEESFGLNVDRCFVLRLGSQHKGTTKPKDGEIKSTGNMWEFKEVKDYDFSTFENVYNLYLALNGGQIPEPGMIQAFPPRLQLLEDV